VPELRTLESVVPYLGDLSALLIDAVAQGAGISFLHPLSREDADRFWLSHEADVKSGKTIMFGSFIDGILVGTVQLKRAWAPNQPHHSDVAKLLVHSAHRRHGLATDLMHALEDKARALNQTLITFDCSAHGHVEAFYKRLGYTCVGHYPDYALTSLGVIEDTALFYKKL
jgi:GNAT superfamily N-acetyltransferase